MAIANKIQTCITQSSWIRKMFEQGAQLRAKFGAENVYDFTIGNPSVEPPKAFHAALKELADNPQPGMHRYMSNAGYDDTRAAVAEAIASRCDQNVQGAQIVMTCGAGGALNVVLKTLLNPGEEVIILAPFFVEYTFYIDNHGGTSTMVPTLSDSFQIDLAAIEQAINKNTKAIIVNSPNNPTGVIYPADDLKALDALLKRKEQELGNQIYVISDEPYARLAYDGMEVPCIFDCIDNSVIVTSHSKDLALPGERIGYLAANPAMAGVDSFMEGAIFANRVLGFVNAPALVQRLITPLQHESVDIAAYEEKRDLFYTILTDLGFDVVKPQGGFYLFPKSPLEDDVAFIEMAQKYNILLVPGKGFGQPGYFRIAYCIDKQIIERSIPAWKQLAAEVGLIQ
ncbi:pyridoxal phosphate-dependent aminotransferase [uncultured Desulfuromonas sp.]|uniref:pyridoxal phosphate-dependent aminotransferase n=1 Tax=uncultured Desulfuromonas sp. TaxID=181013 RepID=UPI002AAB1395|nr:pyridoxal phosphate-dependent aminotransferase [uncultured Desulfuromonas sp.]